MNPVYFLLVDDLEENLISLGTLLRRDELVLLKARSGDEALELLLTYDVALALVDVQMPGLNGFELAELMRGNERTRRVPIIFITAGNTDSQRPFQGYEAGAVDFIQKPIEPNILRSKADVFFELYLQRQQISAQRDELEAYAQALQEADRRKDEFLATLGHELRNPLAPLQHGLDILGKRPEVAASAGEVLEMMVRQVNQMVRLTEDLLDVSRVSEGKIRLRIERINIADAFRLALETTRPLIEATRHSLTVDLPAEPLWLDADLTRISQIISNLLNNAAKYTPEGGSIILSAQAEGDSALITVTDNGIGIPTEMLPQIFELFAQIDNDLHRARGGLGIGLALVKRLVAMHGGAVIAESSGRGRGAVFRVRLPRATSPMPEQSSVATQGGSTALRVLVVDDSPEIAQTIIWMLEEIGHECRLAEDGETALRIAKEFQPDAVLLDIGLRGMNGYEVCRAFRADAELQQATLIAHTGWGENRREALANGADFDHYLTKPASLADFEKVLNKLGPSAVR